MMEEETNKNQQQTKVDGEKRLTEGKASILYDPNTVFYNPVQEFNRDLSILVLKLWIPIRIAEGVPLFSTSHSHKKKRAKKINMYRCEHS